MQMKSRQLMVRKLLHSNGPAETVDSDITTVRTVDEIVAAVADGKEFIRVVAHLDLREGRSESLDYALNSITTTRAIRVCIHLIP